MKWYHMSEKQKLLFATGNPNKLQELKQVLGKEFDILGLRDLEIYEEIPETGKTLDDNARIKAEYLYNKLQQTCLAEDTGLEVEALGGAPGVLSARYAGPDCDASQNIRKILKNLNKTEHRAARFRTVIALIERGKVHYFEGICKGVIATELRGNSGFGYDPIFIPEGYHKSFAEMSSGEKNKISHRRKAVENLLTFLKKRE